jgi:hypothetical protein
MSGRRYGRDPGRAAAVPGVRTFAGGLRPATAPLKGARSVASHPDAVAEFAYDCLAVAHNGSMRRLRTVTWRRGDRILRRLPPGRRTLTGSEPGWRWWALWADCWPGKPA